MEQQDSPPPRPSILFLGASVTSGYGLAPTLAFPSQIQQLINQVGLPYWVLNAASPGASTADGLGQMREYLQAKYRLSHLVIGLGLADAVYGTPLPEIAYNLRQIIHTARQFKPDIRLFLGQARLFQQHVMPQLKQRNGVAYARVFQTVAETEEVVLLPFLLTGVAGKDQLNLPDRLHPNEAGMKIVAQNVWSYLEPHLLD